MDTFWQMDVGGQGQNIKLVSPLKMSTVAPLNSFLSPEPVVKFPHSLGRGPLYL